MIKVKAKAQVYSPDQIETSNDEKVKDNYSQPAKVKQMETKANEKKRKKTLEPGHPTFLTNNQLILLLH